MKEQILERYKGLMEAVDEKTAEVYAGAPEIPCKNKCYDCCKQLFPVSFAEAFHISDGLKTLGRKLRRDRERVTQKITEKILEKNPSQFEKHGVEKITALRTHSEFANFLHKIESDCPALDPKNEAGSCTVYPFRNHDCRTMGASFDGPEKTIVGCFRFSGLKYLVPKLMDFSFRYSEKMLMDRELIAEVTGGMFTSNILYYTTMCGPLVKDYAATDWVKFFSGKNIPARSKPDEYWVVIDV
ncbi:MAG: hypothetical protein AAB588_03985 [Patescibacteria group bacterium]